VLPEKTLLAGNTEPAATMPRKSRLDDVVMVSDPLGSAKLERATASCFGKSYVPLAQIYFVLDV
jgi:hypothetical protein